MNEPVRLHKQDNDVSSLKISERIGDWMLRHPTLTMLILFIALAMLFALVFNVIYHVCTIESGVPRNFMVNDL